MTDGRRLCPWCDPGEENELHGHQQACSSRCRKRKERALKRGKMGAESKRDSVTGHGHISITVIRELITVNEHQTELFERMLEKIDYMCERLDHIEERLQSPAQPPRQHPDLPPPDEMDTAEIEIKQATADANNNSAWNFQIQTAGMGYGSYDHLPPEIVEYGLRTGRISNEQIQ